MERQRAASGRREPTRTHNGSGGTDCCGPNSYRLALCLRSFGSMCSYVGGGNRERDRFCAEPELGVSSFGVGGIGDDGDRARSYNAPRADGAPND